MESKLLNKVACHLFPMVIEGDMEEAIYDFMGEYKNYFEEFSSGEICLNVAPNYAVIKDFGIVTFGKNEKEASILNDIIEHTMLAVLRADKLGGYQGISLKDCFEMEYWELEQAKLRKIQIKRQGYGFALAVIEISLLLHQLNTVK